MEARRAPSLLPQLPRVAMSAQAILAPHFGQFAAVAATWFPQFVQYFQAPPPAAAVGWTCATGCGWTGCWAACCTGCG